MSDRRPEQWREWFAAWHERGVQGLAVNHDETHAHELILLLTRAVARADDALSNASEPCPHCGAVFDDTREIEPGPDEWAHHKPDCPVYIAQAILQVESQ